MKEACARDRVKRLLDGDKEEIGDATRVAVLRDFSHFAAEYFELDGEPSLRIERGKRGLAVTLSFRAARVKNFTVLKN